jgi:hypothetical protein
MASLLPNRLRQRSMAGKKIDCRRGPPGEPGFRALRVMQKIVNEQLKKVFKSSMMNIDRADTA